MSHVTSITARANSSSESGSSGSNGSSIQAKHMPICEMLPSVRQRLCEHLDELNVWNQLAVIMSLKPAEVQTIRRKQAILGNSPSNELLKIWGEQYNHTVTELFVVFKKQKLYPAMRIIKDLVSRKYHLLIPNSQPILSELLAPATEQNNNNTEHSKKILNCSSSSGVSNSNNADSQSFNTTSSINNTSISEQQRSNYLSARNVKEYASSIPEMDYGELTEATNSWSDQYILGKGGFGTVYRGYWKHTDVAIKQIHYRGPNGRESAKVQLQQSLNELKYLNSCRHDNVLPLYGYSIKGEKPCLVYQLMKGGSLETRLYSKQLAPLTFEQRINICLGTARGINYLHTFRDKPLIHGDIKPANVLLDQCLHPKLGDFGLAREGPSAVNSTVEVTHVFGTKPYLPPEFLNSKKLSTQVDTYSFGMVLLETFTGLRVYDKQRAQPHLTTHIVHILNNQEQQLQDVIDKRVTLQPGDLENCLHSIKLGLHCTATSPQHRPEMERVLETINAYYTTNRN